MLLSLTTLTEGRGNLAGALENSEERASERTHVRPPSMLPSSAAFEGPQIRRRRLLLLLSFLLLFTILFLPFEGRRFPSPSSASERASERGITTALSPSLRFLPSRVCRLRIVPERARGRARAGLARPRPSWRKVALAADAVWCSLGRSLQQAGGGGSSSSSSSSSWLGQ